MSPEVKNAIKAGAFTALWTFIGMFSLAFFGWLNDVQAWATGDGAATVFPDTAVLVKAAIAAVAAAAGGLVGTFVRLAQVFSGKGDVPKYNNG